MRKWVTAAAAGVGAALVVGAVVVEPRPAAATPSVWAGVPARPAAAPTDLSCQLVVPARIVIQPRLYDVLADQRGCPQAYAGTVWWDLQGTGGVGTFTFGYAATGVDPYRDMTESISNLTEPGTYRFAPRRFGYRDGDDVYHLINQTASNPVVAKFGSTVTKLQVEQRRGFTRVRIAATRAAAGDTRARPAAGQAVTLVRGTKRVAAVRLNAAGAVVLRLPRAKTVKAYTATLVETGTVWPATLRAVR